MYLVNKYSEFENDSLKNREFKWCLSVGAHKADGIHHFGWFFKRNGFKFIEKHKSWMQFYVGQMLRIVMNKYYEFGIFLWINKVFGNSKAVSGQKLKCFRGTNLFTKMDFYFIFLLFGRKFELNMDRKQTTKRMRYYMKILSVYKDHKIQQYDENSF